MVFAFHGVVNCSSLSFPDKQIDVDEQTSHRAMQETDVWDAVKSDVLDAGGCCSCWQRVESARKGRG